MLLVTVFISLVFQRANVFFYDYLFPLNKIKKKEKKRKRKKKRAKSRNQKN